MWMRGECERPFPAEVLRRNGFPASSKLWPNRRKRWHRRTRYAFLSPTEIKSILTSLYILGRLEAIGTECHSAWGAVLKPVHLTKSTWPPANFKIISVMRARAYVVCLPLFFLSSQVTILIMLGSHQLVGNAGARSPSMQGGICVHCFIVINRDVQSSNKSCSSMAAAQLTSSRCFEKLSLAKGTLVISKVLYVANESSRRPIVGESLGSALGQLRLCPRYRLSEAALPFLTISALLHLKFYLFFCREPSPDSCPMVAVP